MKGHIFLCVTDVLPVRYRGPLSTVFRCICKLFVLSFSSRKTYSPTLPIDPRKVASFPDQDLVSNSIVTETFVEGSVYNELCLPGSQSTSIPKPDDFFVILQ